MGEAPSKSGDRYHMVPLSGRVAETLCKLAGVPPQEGGTRYGQWTWALYEHFECENLIERYPGAQGKGASFPMEVARPRAVEVVPRLEGRVVVVLGSRLKSLFTLANDFGVWHENVVTYTQHGKVVSARCQAVGIPHPSGLNRMFNDEVERQRCGEVLREAMRRAGAEAVA